MILGRVVFRLDARHLAAWLAVALLLCTDRAGAVPGVWNQTASNFYSWDTASNWLNNTIASGTTAADTANFGSLDIAGEMEIRLITNTAHNISMLTVGDTSGGSSINFSTGPGAGSNTALVFNSGNGGITLNAGAGDTTFGQLLVLKLDGGNQFWTNNSTTGRLIIVSDIFCIAVNNRTLTFTGAGDTFVKGSIAESNTGQLALTKSGVSSTLTLSGSNTYRGITSIRAGTLAFSSGANLGVNAALSIGSVGSTGTLLYTGNGETISKAIQMEGVAGGATILNNGGALNFTGNVTPIVDGAKTLNVDGTGNVILGGVISNSAASATSLAKSGAGTLTLSGANTFTGNVSVTGGKLALAGGAAIANSVAVSLTNTSGVSMELIASETIGSLSGGGSSGGELHLNTSTLTVGGSGANTTFSGAITGSSGSLTKTGAGILTLTGNNSTTGGVKISGGTLQSKGSTPTSGVSPPAINPLGGGTVTLESGTTLRFVTTAMAPPTVKPSPTTTMSSSMALPISPTIETAARPPARISASMT